MLNASNFSTMKNSTLTLSYATVDFANGSINWKFGMYQPKLEKKLRAVMNLWSLYQDADLLNSLYSLEA